MRPKNLEWVHTQVLVPLGELGLLRFAHLESQAILNRLTINSMYQTALPGPDYEFRHFTPLPEARAWAAGA